RGCFRGVNLSGMATFALPFFFQAEDGIRDFHVTGVQTCALPICHRVDATRDGRQTFAGSASVYRYPAAHCREQRDGPSTRGCWEIGRAACRERGWIWGRRGARRRRRKRRAKTSVGRGYECESWTE